MQTTIFTINSNLRKCWLFSCFAVMLFCLCSLTCRASSISIGVKNNDNRLLFLQSLKDFSANYKQTTYTEKKPEYADGELFIKTPNKIMIRHQTKVMTLKIASIDGVLKAVDENVGQITYVENQYNDLLKLFDNKLDAKELHYNFNNELCLAFEHQGAYLDGCLNVDAKQNTIKSMSLYGIILPDNGNKNKNDDKKNYKLSNDDIVNSKFIQIIKLDFTNTKVNKGISDDVFEIKDNRIFGDDE